MRSLFRLLAITALMSLSLSLGQFCRQHNSDEKYRKDASGCDSGRSK